MRKKTKMANICRSLRKKQFFSPVLKSPTHIGFIGVKKNGSKISHLGTFNVPLILKMRGINFFCGKLLYGPFRGIFWRGQDFFDPLNCPIATRARICKPFKGPRNRFPAPAHRSFAVYVYVEKNLYCCATVIWLRFITLTHPVTQISLVTDKTYSNGIFLFITLREEIFVSLPLVKYIFYNV